MSHDDPMPDFAAALEVRLREAAVSHADPAAAAPAAGPGTAASPGAAPGSARPRARRPAWRPWAAWTPRRALVTAGIALVAVLAVVLGAGPRTPPAVGRPPILGAPRVTDPEYLRGILRNSSMLGTGADYAGARAVGSPGGTAYLVHGRGVWCLTVPDPATDDPEHERGMGCVSDAEFERFGVMTGIGDTVIVAVADGARRPTVRDSSGYVRTLVPNADGVVIVRRLLPGQRLTRYAADGTPKVFARVALDGTMAPSPADRGRTRPPDRLCRSPVGRRTSICRAQARRDAAARRLRRPASGG